MLRAALVLLLALAGVVTAVAPASASTVTTLLSAYNVQVTYVWSPLQAPTGTLQLKLTSTTDTSKQWVLNLTNDTRTLATGTISVDPRDLSGGGALLSYTFGSSTTGQHYLPNDTYTVRLVYPSASGTITSNAATVTTHALMDAPTGVTATAGNGQASVSWTPGAANGSVISGYTVTASPGGATCSSLLLTTCAVTGLANGTAYAFTVVATSLLASSAPSAPSSAVTPATVPGAPRTVTATHDEAQSVVSWVAPASTGGAAITGYEVTASPGGATCTTATTSCTVTGLDDGTAYVMSVTATNRVGTGAAGTSSPVTPGFAPGAASNVTATAGNGQATVSWDPATSTGLPVLGYSVTASPGGATCSTLLLTTCTVTGLTNGTAYTFTVTATNLVGTSVASPPSSAVTPATVPGAPRNVAATHDEAQSVVSWVAPVSTGGAAVTGYTATASPGGATCTTATTSCLLTGLDDGTAYVVSVTATNRVGTGPAGTSSPVTPGFAPGAASNVTATAGNGQATVSWDPATSVGLPVLGYSVTASPGGATCSTLLLTTCTVTGLTNGTAYTFTATATNLVGTSVASAPSSAVTPVTVPGAPRNVAATVDDARSTVTWDAPVSTGGAAVTGYTVTASPGGATCTTTTALTCTLEGLVDATTYTVAVTADNVAGTGPAGTSDPFVPGSVMGSPTGVTATPGDGDAWVDWVAPTGGLPILGYTVTASPGGATCLALAATGCRVPGLTNGTAYSFTVAAFDLLGGTLTSLSSAVVTPLGVPTAPGDVTVERGSGQATVSWTPAGANGSPLTGYTVTASPGGATCSTATTSCTVHGLTDGTAYSFTVRAANAVGLGLVSAVSALVVPGDVPATPTGVSATAGDSEAQVSWSAAADHGYALSAYTVTASPGGATCSSLLLTACTVTGLTNGTAYTFTVVATNLLGDSTASFPTSGVTPAAVPTAPRHVAATVDDGRSVVSWDAPASTGGAAVTGYTATASPGGATCTTSGLSCTLDGLANATSYTVAVTATNRVGTGPAGTSDPVVPGFVPGAATDVQATPGDGQADVHWTAPSGGGLPILGYTVTASPGGATCTTVLATGCTVPGLMNGTAYSFTVTALNLIGASLGSLSSALVTPAGVPGAPTDLQVTRGDRQAHVSWSAADPNGALLTGYTVTASPGGATCLTLTTACTVDGLDNGTAYSFRVRAANPVGPGLLSLASDLVVPAGHPAAPTDVTAVDGNGQALVSWTPGDANGSLVTGYTVTASPGGATCSTLLTSCVVDGLSNGTPYAFTVTASNLVGDSVASLASALVTPATLPGAPTAPTAVPGDHRADVSWTAPASTGGAVLTGYLVTASPGGATCLALTPAGCTVTGLANGTGYTFVVRALNRVGTGAASLVSALVTPAGRPAAPTGVVATDGNAQATVQWTAPDANGSPLTGFTVTASPGGATCASVAATTCTVTGLDNGTAYTFTVTATNAAGDSDASDPSDPVTPATVPGQPGQVTAERGNARAEVSWAAPSDDGGATVTDYLVTAVPGGATCTTSGTSCVVTGLTNGTPYGFLVTATNRVGTGLPSLPSDPVVPAMVPDAPQDVTGVGGDGEVAVSWTAATGSGSPVTGYAVTASPGGATCTTTGATTCTVPGLTNGTAYRFSVRAHNEVGDSLASAASAPVTPATVPDAPTGLVATRGDGEVALTWVPPAGTGGATVTGYTVTAESGGGTCSTSGTGCTVHGLSNGTAYRFRVVATNRVGDGTPSDWSTSVTPAGVPGAPAGVTATASDGQADVSWQAPDGNGSPVTGYAVTASPGGATCTTSGTTCTVPGLTNGTSYTFTVVATNDVGSGSASAPSAPVVPAAVVPPPPSHPLTGTLTKVLTTKGTTSLVVTYRLSAPARVTVQLRRGKVVVTKTFTAAAGRHRVTLKLTKKQRVLLVNRTKVTVTLRGPDKHRLASVKATVKAKRKHG